MSSISRRGLGGLAFLAVILLVAAEPAHALQGIRQMRMGGSIGSQGGMAGGGRTNAGTSQRQTNSSQQKTARATQRSTGASQGQVGTLQQASSGSGAIEPT